MGLLIHTTFETAEGVPISNVYLRISAITCEFMGHVRVVVQYERSVSRQKRLEGRVLNFVPDIPDYVVYTIPKTEVWSDIPLLYERIKTSIQDLGFTVEDVLESPTPEPTGPTGTEGTTEPEGPTGTTGTEGTTEPEGPTGTEAPTGETGPTEPTQ